MGIDTPLQIGVLIAFGAFTAAIITAFVRYMLKSKSFSQPNPNLLDLIVGRLFFFTFAAFMSFLLFDALAYGVAYGIGGGNTGNVHSISQEPGFYWFWVAIYYGFAVAALSAGVAVGARLIQPQRSLSEADLMKKTSGRVSKLAAPSSDNALDSKNEMSDTPYKAFEKLWRNANIVYIGLLIALYVYWGYLGRMPMPGIWMLVAGALAFVSSGLFTIYTGETNDSPHYNRSKNPIMYWLDVGGQLFIGIGLFLAGILAGIGVIGT